MTQQSCEQSDAHDVFFPSGLFVKQQQIQCQTPQTHQSSQNQQQKSHGTMPYGAASTRPGSSHARP